MLLFTLHCLLLLAVLRQSPSSWEIVSVRLSERTGSPLPHMERNDMPFDENGKWAVPLQMLFYFAGSTQRCITGQVF